MRHIIYVMSKRINIYSVQIIANKYVRCIYNFKLLLLVILELGVKLEKDEIDFMNESTSNNKHMEYIINNYDSILKNME